MRPALCCPFGLPTTDLPAAPTTLLSRLRPLPAPRGGDAAADHRATYAVPLATWLAGLGGRRGTEPELASATIDDVEDFR